MYFIIRSMYFRRTFKIKKPKLRCCLTWVVFIELIFTVAFLLKSKIWKDRFAGKGGGWGILRNGGVLVTGESF